MLEFTPTYLYVKRHAVTGMLYLGKTTKPDPYKYNGSGTYWKKHIKKHGYQIETIWASLFTEQNDLIECAEFMSEFYNIVDDSKWANLTIENGLDGRTPYSMPSYHKESLREVRKKQIMAPFSKERKENHSKLMTSLICEGKIDYSNRKTNSEKMKGRKSNLPKITCPHCNKTGVLGAMHRWHLDNCKDKK